MAMSMLDQRIHMTVRIECDRGRSSGTGFIYNFCQQERTSLPAIVTNKHVIAGAQFGVFHMTVAENDEPKYGEHVQVALGDFEALGRRSRGFPDHTSPPGREGPRNATLL